MQNKLLSIFLIIAHNMKSKIKLICTLMGFLLSTFHLYAQQLRIANFTVKENLTQNGKLAIVALDSLENPAEEINGTFVFNLNGFQQDLIFHDGVAVVTQPIASSTFVLFKHKNQEKTLSGFYYIHKKEGKLQPFKVNGLLLLLIPAAILLIAYLFRKFLVTFVILALAYAYFHFSKGLSFGNILESILDALQNLI